MLRNYVFLLIIGSLWGSQFLFQQEAVSSLPAVWVGAGRSMVAFLGLFIICKMIGIKGSKINWKKYHFIGLLEATIPFVLVAWGQQYLDTAIAAILMGTIPFFAVIASPFIVKGSKVTVAGLGSVLLGFAGLVTLFYPDISSGDSNISFIGSVAIIVASASFATSLLIIKQYASEDDPMVVARNVLGCSAMQVFVLANILYPVNTIDPTMSSIGSVVYLGIMCGAIVYFLYMILIRDAGPVFASMNNYLVPLIGVILGATFNNEALSVYTFVALFIILAAVAFNQIFSEK